MIEDTLADPDVTERSEQGSGVQATAAAAGAPPRGPAAPPMSSVIGRFALLRKLGEGSMGVVYLGYDELLDRRVALKVMQVRRTSVGPERMLREAQALARLSHPNVVQIHEVGAHEGGLFIAMEFVEGLTLDRWLAEHSRSRAQILAVFRAAGRGLAAAHAAKLVHRDFKPQNLMITSTGEAKVMDFGLVVPEDDEAPHEDDEADHELSASTLRARASRGALGSGSMTQTGVLMGTPAYMSPEQFLGRRVDPRSDQFSFCVSLWEALYGERPYRGDGLRELHEAVIAGKLREPSRGVSVPRRLRAALEQGLRVDPGERWDSMEALLEVLAEPAPVRRWATVGLALASCVALGWGLAPRDGDRSCADLGADIEQVWSDASAVELRASMTATGLSYADDTAVRVGTRLDAYATRWTEVRTETCRASQRGTLSDALLDRRMGCLDQRRVELDALVDALTRADTEVVNEAVSATQQLRSPDDCAELDALDEPHPRPEAAQLAARLDTLEVELARLESLRAIGKYDEALAELDALLPEAEAIDHPPALIRARMLQGSLRWRSGDYEGAEAALLRTYDLALGHALLSEAALAASALIYVTGHLRGHPQEGMRWARDAEPLGRAQTSPLVRARIQQHMGIVHHDLGEYARARELLRAAYGEQAARLGEAHPTSLTTLNNLATTEKAWGNDERALAYRERALELQRETLGPTHPEVALTLNNLAAVLQDQARYEEAQRAYERALAIYREAYEPDHPLLADTLNNLGVNADEAGRTDEALAYYDQARELWVRRLGPEHPRIAYSWHNIGSTEYEHGRYEDARTHLLHALELMERALGPEHPTLGYTLNTLGNLEKSQGDYAAARAYLERALLLRREALAADNPLIASTLTNLGILAQVEGDHARAEALFNESLELREAKLGPEHPKVANSLSNLGELALARGELELALRHHRRAYEIRSAALGEDHERVGRSLSALGETLLELGRHADALEVLERALATLTRAKTQPVKLARARFSLARVLMHLPPAQGGDPTRALELAQAAERDYASASGRVEQEQRARIEAWLAQQ